MKKLAPGVLESPSVLYTSRQSALLSFISSLTYAGTEPSALSNQGSLYLFHVCLFCDTVI